MDRDLFFSFLAKRRNRHGDTTIGSWNSRLFYSKQFAILRDLNVLHGDMLEIGPGEGHLARRCRSVAMNYKAIERSSALQAQLTDDGFDVILGSAPPLPFDDEQFRVVCAMAVLEHMPTFNEALQLLQECHRVLKREGTLAILVPDVLRAGPDFYNWDYTHSFITTPFRVRQILGDAGFRETCLIHFTGAITSPLRFPVDLVAYAVHTRFAYWLGTIIGFESLLYKFHKTFEPCFMIVSRKL